MIKEESRMLAFVDFPDVGRVLQTNIPHGVSSLPTNIKNFKEASRLGQDTEEVLYELGVSKEKVQYLPPLPRYPLLQVPDLGCA